MKRVCFIFMLFATLLPISAIAQEIRGVEIKTITYEGKDHNGDVCYWAAFEFVNKNSIPVSVDAELFRSKPEDEDYSKQYRYTSSMPEQDISHIYPRLISAQSFVLQPGESYLWKHETESYYSSALRSIRFAFRSGKIYWRDAQNYFVKYKAYKLQ
ncbi:MAG: hypothetical protein IKL83_03170 [Muribaculaceae bacterium]|nr:hypothetical protein [Muribaculaceae bacterium]